MIAQHFFETTQETGRRFMPKELHKMKTSVVNNALLGLIVIENKLYKHIIYNDKAMGFVD